MSAFAAAPRTAVALLALLSLAVLAPSADARGLRQPSIVTGTVGLEGEACGEDEYKRYTSIVCKIQDTCGCAETVCELDWCNTYIHEWKKTFGACILKGCPK
mmetsp:Transcript_77565/g.166281  ORF Transcript_77565/g.166281 Transcript_77565/m.166281 type:complete len:102 (+) Transcript_77565:81-386(+)